ncbi:MAG: TolC family protein [Candidatus Omnitrophica bacterium]|nr:TolC family protein [Candidatus Omnitrophota bacterium]
MRIRSFCLMLVTILAAAGAQAAEAPSLAFDQFYQQVVEHNPGLRSAAAEVELSWARKMQASAGFWPSLSVTAGFSESDDPVNVFGMLLRQERFSQSDFELNRLNTPRHQRDLQGGVHLRWPLFDAMRTVRTARAAREQVKAAQADEKFVVMEAFLLAHDAYSGALALEQMLVIAEEAVSASGEDLKKAQDLKDKGLVLGADFYAARVRAGRFSQARNELTRQVKSMRLLLNIMRGAPLASEFTLPLSAGKAEPAGVPAADLLAQAQETRPDFVALAARVNARREEVLRARDSILPTVTLTADGTNNRRDLGDRGGNNAALGVVADLPLFDPARSGRIKEASALLELALAQQQALRDTAASDLARENARYEALQANYPVVLAMAEDSARAVEMLLPLYSEGRKSITDLEDARDARLSAASALAEMRWGLITSRARLLFLSGQLNADGIKAVSAGITNGN